LGRAADGAIVLPPRRQEDLVIRTACKWLTLTCIVLAGCAGTRTASQGPTLSGLRALTDSAGYADPAWSEDGAFISVAGEGSRGLYVIPSGGGDVQPIADPADVVAFRHRWEGGVIVAPARGASPALQVSPRDGTVQELPQWEPPVWVERDDVFVRIDGEEVRVTQGEDRFIDPLMSPDRAHVAFVGLTTGVHVIELETRTIAHLGAGTRPAWSSDSAYVLFERTEDDGANVTGADLWCWSESTGETTPLTSTPDAIERYPAVSPDGAKVAFVRDGGLWIGEFAGADR